MEDRLEEWVGDDRGFHTGDRGYQDKLENIGEIEEEIERRESMPKNNEHKMNNLMGFEQFSLNEGKKPSEGLSDKKKSAIVKKAKKGGDIGKKGKNFDKVVAKAEKKYGKEKAKKIAAASMWKNINR